MDLTLLATEITEFLVLILPYLGKMSEKAAEEVSGKIGLDIFEGAKGLLGKLRPKVEARGAAQEALNDVIASPENKNAQAALRLQIKKILSEGRGVGRVLNRRGIA